MYVAPLDDNSSDRYSPLPLTQHYPNRVRTAPTDSLRGQGGDQRLLGVEHKPTVGFAACLHAERIGGEPITGAASLDGATTDKDAQLLSPCLMSYVKSCMHTNWPRVFASGSSDIHI